MGILDSIESAFMRATWINEIPEAIVAIVSGPIGCGGTVKPATAPTTGPDEYMAESPVCQKVQQDSMERISKPESV